MQQLDERLKGQYASLSPQEQRVADFIFDHFDDLISYNSAELAQLSGVSKATVSRLFKRLGYDKYKDMRDELRTLRQSGLQIDDVLDLADLLVVNAHELADLTEQPDFEPLGDWTAVVEATRAAVDGIVSVVSSDGIKKPVPSFKTPPAGSHIS
mgnify:CR=1 FL=1